MNPGVLGIIAAVLTALDRIFASDTVPEKLHISHAWRLVIKLAVGAAVTAFEASGSTGQALGPAVLAAFVAVLPSLITQIVEAVSTPAVRVEIVDDKSDKRGLADVDMLAVFGVIAFLALLATMLLGCAHSFEESKIAGRGVTVAAAPPPTERCVALDNAHIAWSAAATGAAVLSGAYGLTTIPVHDETAKVGLAIGTVASASAAALFTSLANGSSESWARECSK